jgi:hypothetical protein
MMYLLIAQQMEKPWQTAQSRAVNEKSCKTAGVFVKEDARKASHRVTTSAAALSTPILAGQKKRRPTYLKLNGVKAF